MDLWKLSCIESTWVNPQPLQNCLNFKFQMNPRGTGHSSFTRMKVGEGIWWKYKSVRLKSWNILKNQRLMVRNILAE